MNFKRLASRTEKHEGFKSKPYKDHLGNWTIGFGSTTWHNKPVTEVTPAVTIEQARHQMYADLYQACVDAQNFFANIEYLSPFRQEVIVEMAYQLGYPKLCQFKKLHQALTLQDWKLASQSMRNSLWYSQTPVRVQELIELMLADD